MQTWNSGTTFAMTDMLGSIWNFLAGTILPEAAGLAVVGAILNYARHRPFMPLVGSGLAFLECFGPLETGAGDGSVKRGGGDCVARRWNA